MHVVYICATLLLSDYFAAFWKKSMAKILKQGKHIKEDFEEKKEDWKSKLSGAFTSEQIFYSLLVLGVFYAGYTIASVDRQNFDVNSKNEDDIIESCSCSNGIFYRSLFTFCCGLWFFLHTYTYVAVIPFQSLKKCFKAAQLFCLSILKGLWNRLMNLFKDCCNFCCSCKNGKGTTAKNVTPNSHSESGSNLYNFEPKIKQLWFQYYKLFVVGYGKGTDDKVILNDLQVNDKDEPTKPDERDKEDSGDKDCHCFSVDTESCNTEKLKDYACGCNKKYSVCFSGIKGFYIMSLLLVKYVAQLLTMPSLLFQIFDTYALVCFSPNLFCKNSSEYKPHLAQVMITLLFYCFLTISQLASTMLSWNPWPNKDNEHDEKLS